MVLWGVCLCFQTQHRVLQAWINFMLLRGNRQNNLTSLSLLCSVLLVIENVFLAMLSFASSRYGETRPFHEAGFVGFQLTSMVYMPCFLYLLQQSYPPHTSDIRGVRSRVIAWRVNVCAVVLAVFTYIRHNSACEDFVYSLFALSEWSIVASNIAFHLLSAMDMKGCELSLNFDVASAPTLPPWNLKAVAAAGQVPVGGAAGEVRQGALSVGVAKSV